MEKNISKTQLIIKNKFVMIVCYQVEVDESQTTLSKDELLQLGLQALACAFEKTGAYYDVGYNPQMVIKGKKN